jgi:invasion protein IalB
LADPRSVLLSARGAVGAVNPVSLNYIPWTKFCLKSQDGSARQVCFTGKDGRIESGAPVVAAVVIESEGDPKKILRVTLPIGVQLVPGTRVMVDNAAPLVNPFVICFANGCMADYEATPELIGDLMRGRTLVVQAINGDGAQLSLELPLQEGGGAGFAKARYDPPTDPKVYQQTQQKLQAEWASKAKPAQASPTSSPSHPGARPSGH